MTVEEFVKLVISDENVRDENYKKEMFEAAHYITDKKNGCTIITYFKGAIVDCIRISKDIYFYSDIYGAFVEWVKNELHLEQFYFTGNILWVQSGDKDVKEYFTDIIALDISLKEKKIIVHELDVFSESKKTVIESPRMKELKNLCERVTEQTKYAVCPVVYDAIVEVYLPEVNQRLHFKGVKDIKVDMERYKAVVTFFEKDKEDFTIEF